MDPKPVDGARVRLRPAGARSDVEPYQRLLGDPVAMASLGGAWSRERSYEALRESVEKWHQLEAGSWLIDIIDGPDAPADNIGVIAFLRNPDSWPYECTVVLDPRYNRDGYGDEALKLALDRHFALFVNPVLLRAVAGAVATDVIPGATLEPGGALAAEVEIDTWLSLRRGEVHERAAEPGAWALSSESPPFEAGRPVRLTVSFTSVADQHPSWIGTELTVLVMAQDHRDMPLASTRLRMPAAGETVSGDLEIVPPTAGWLPLRMSAYSGSGLLLEAVTRLQVEPAAEPQAPGARAL